MTLDSKESLKVHKVSVHPNVVTEKVPCLECNKVYHKRALVQHIETKHKGIRYSCDSCEYVTTQKVHLKTHINAAHLKSKQFACSKCDKSFTSKYHKNSHMSRIHEKMVKIKCIHCPKEINQLNMKTHVLRLHSEAENVPCDFCDFIGRSKRQLKDHTRFKHSSKS